jgi:uncharacterized membrane protein
MGAEPTRLGPVQALVIGFADGSFERGVIDELERLREQDAIRLVDLLFVAKDSDGDIAVAEQADLSGVEASEFGALAGALIGLGDSEDPVRAAVDATAAARNGASPSSDDVWYLADAIAPGSAAAIVLIEHRWATPLRDAIEASGSGSLADAWVHPQDLAAIGGARG